MEDEGRAGRMGDQTEPGANGPDRETPPQSPGSRGRDRGRQQRRVFDGVVVSPTAIAVASLVVAIVGYTVSRYDRLEDQVVAIARETRGYFVEHISSAHGDGVEAERGVASHEASDQDTVSTLQPAPARGSDPVSVSDTAMRLFFATTVGVGNTAVELTADQGRAALILQVDPGRYRIVASPAAENVDPVLYLYRAWQGTLNEVDQDDDGGAGLAARIDADIADGRYFLEVEELSGDRGEIDLEIRLAE